jgi:hypothetical protein
MLLESALEQTKNIVKDLNLWRGGLLAPIRKRSPTSSPGAKQENAKRPLFPQEVLKEDHDGDAFRAVYTLRFSTAVYVLNAFQKKSKSGIATPKHEIELITKRMKDAEAW